MSGYEPRVSGVRRDHPLPFVLKTFCPKFKSLAVHLPTFACGQSHKYCTLRLYNPRVVLTLKLLQLSLWSFGYKDL